ncbi:class I SAM-dependent methyltransferase [candidate division KSB1 bacterium]|nr:class I SAM-dependent methyltransferase [candidate division KSB1 bacterium]
MSAVSEILQAEGRLGAPDFAVMEFGCGDGFQIPHLRQFGKVSASDLYTSDGIRAMPDLEYHECRIERTPFQTGQFDLIYSNQVFQDIPESILPQVFTELKRIGKPGCIYAFTVPTNHWLILRIPAHYWNNLRFVLQRIRHGDKGLVPGSTHFATQTSGAVETRQKRSLASKLSFLLLPSGIGGYPGFWNAFRKMSVRSWMRRLEALGFQRVDVRRLLVYSPSEWPIMPINTWMTRLGICSSALIVFRVPR